MRDGCCAPVCNGGVLPYKSGDGPPRKQSGLVERCVPNIAKHGRAAVPCEECYGPRVQPPSAEGLRAGDPQGVTSKAGLTPGALKG